jgi:hypothetical protein
MAELLFDGKRRGPAAMLQACRRKSLPEAGRCSRRRKARSAVPMSATRAAWSTLSERP